MQSTTALHDAVRIVITTPIASTFPLSIVDKNHVFHVFVALVALEVEEEEDRLAPSAVNAVCFAAAATSTTPRRRRL
jgi:hypothetical protein